MKYNKSAIGIIFAIIATALWAGNFIVARGLNAVIPPVTLAFWRWLVATLCLLPFTYNYLRKEFPILKRNKFYVLGVAFSGVTLFNTIIYLAAQTTTALNLSLISITFPIFIMLISRFVFKESFGIFKIIGIFLVLVGVITLITKGDFGSLMSLKFSVGDAWMLLAAIIFAIYSILLRKKPKDLSIWSLQLSTFIIGLILLFPVFLIEQNKSFEVTYSWDVISQILYIGIFASLAAFILWNKAIDIIGPTKAGIIYYTLPIFSGILAFLFLNEKIYYLHLISAILIIFGVILTNRKENRFNKL